MSQASVDSRLGDRWAQVLVEEQRCTLCRARLESGDVRLMRDATRGGVATVLNEWAQDGQPAAMLAHPLGSRAAVIGEILSEPPGMVFMHTAFGWSRLVDMLIGDPLPRIC